MNKIQNKYRIYGRQRGRKKIKIADDSLFNKFSFNIKKDLNKNKKIIIDIGSGNGENSILLSKNNPKALIIACDPFLDGNINLSNELFKLNIQNVKFYKNNVLELFSQLKTKSYFSEVWILFPDPWPKKRHHKRRLLNYEFFKQIYNLIKKNGKILIATDSPSYLKSILSDLYNLQRLFKWENQIFHEWQYITQHLPSTKFFKKAYISERSSTFIKLRKI